MTQIHKDNQCISLLQEQGSRTCYIGTKCFPDVSRNRYNPLIFSCRQPPLRLLWRSNPIDVIINKYRGKYRRVLASYLIVIELVEDLLVSYLFASLYCSSLTGSSHSFDSGSLTWTWVARCWNHEFVVAPCQCFTPSGMSMMSPA